MKKRHQARRALSLLLALCMVLSLFTPALAVGEDGSTGTNDGVVETLPGEGQTPPEETPPAETTPVETPAPSETVPPTETSTPEESAPPEETTPVETAPPVETVPPEEEFPACDICGERHPEGECPQQTETLTLSGTGTEADPYLITSAADFAEIPDKTYAHYRQTANFTLSSVAAKYFYGVYNGGSHTITLSGTSRGLFDTVGDGISEAIIKNLGVVGSVNAGKTVGYSLMAILKENSKVYNCWNAATVNGTINGVTSVFIAVSSGTVANCYNLGTLNHAYNAGMFFWTTENSTLFNLYNAGSPASITIDDKVKTAAYTYWRTNGSGGVTNGYAAGSSVTNSAGLSQANMTATTFAARLNSNLDEVARLSGIPRSELAPWKQPAGSYPTLSVTPLTSVSVSGAPGVGQTLTATPAPAGATATYEWQRSNGDDVWTDIAGATGATYTMVAADEGKDIRVTARGIGIYSGTVASAKQTVRTLKILAAPTETTYLDGQRLKLEEIRFQYQGKEYGYKDLGSLPGVTLTVKNGNQAAVAITEKTKEFRMTRVSISDANQRTLVLTLSDGTMTDTNSLGVVVNRVTGITINDYKFQTEYIENSYFDFTGGGSTFSRASIPLTINLSFLSSETSMVENKVLNFLEFDTYGVTLKVGDTTVSPGEKSTWLTSIEHHNGRQLSLTAAGLSPTVAEHIYTIRPVEVEALEVGYLNESGEFTPAVSGPNLDTDIIIDYYTEQGLKLDNLVARVSHNNPREDFTVTYEQMTKADATGYRAGFQWYLMDGTTKVMEMTQGYRIPEQWVGKDYRLGLSYKSETTSALETGEIVYITPDPIRVERSRVLSIYVTNPPNNVFFEGQVVAFDEVLVRVTTSGGNSPLGDTDVVLSYDKFPSHGINMYVEGGGQTRWPAGTPATWEMDGKEIRISYTDSQGTTTDFASGLFLEVRLNKVRDMSLLYTNASGSRLPVTETTRVDYISDSVFSPANLTLTVTYMNGESVTVPLDPDAVRTARQQAVYDCVRVVDNTDAQRQRVTTADHGEPLLISYYYDNPLAPSDGSVDEQVYRFGKMNVIRAPGKVQNLKATPSYTDGHIISLTWDALTDKSEGAGYGTIEGYEVYAPAYTSGTLVMMGYKASNGTYTAQIRYDDATLPLEQAGTTYEFYILPINSYIKANKAAYLKENVYTGTGVPSTTALGTVSCTTWNPPMEEPTNVTAILGADKTEARIQVSWDALPKQQADGSEIRRYRVYLSTNQYDAGEMYIDVNADQTTVELVNGDNISIELGKAYYAYVAAHNEVGVGAAGRSTGTVTPYTTPTAPRTLTVTSATASSVSLTWDAPAQDGGSGIKEYLVRWFKADSDVEVGRSTRSRTQSNVTINNLEPKSAYRVEIQAQCNADALGLGPAAILEVATSSKPSAPRDFLVEPTLVGTEKAPALNFAWSWSTSLSNGAAITGYRLFATDVESNAVTYVDVTEAGTLKYAYSLSDSSWITAGKTYRFTVAALYVDEGVTAHGARSELIEETARVATGLSVTAQPELKYVEGLALDLSKLTATLTYSDGTSTLYTYAQIAASAYLSASVKQGERSIAHKGILGLSDHGGVVTVSYQRGNVSLHAVGSAIIVANKDVKEITVSVQPNSSYIEGQQLDLTGLMITLTYNDGRTSGRISYANLASNGVILSYNGADVEYGSEPDAVYGVNQLNFSIPGKDVDAEPQPITVSAKRATSITVDESSAVKSLYQTGEPFDGSGFVIYVVYDNGKNEIIRYGSRENVAITFSKTGTVTPLDQGVQVTADVVITNLAGETDEQKNLSATGIELTSGWVTEFPGFTLKNQYTEGQTLDVKNLTAQVRFGTGTEIVTLSYQNMVDGKTSPVLNPDGSELKPSMEIKGRFQLFLDMGAGKTVLVWDINEDLGSIIVPQAWSGKTLGIRFIREGAESATVEQLATSALTVTSFNALAFMPQLSNYNYVAGQTIDLNEVKILMGSDGSDPAILSMEEARAYSLNAYLVKGAEKQAVPYDAASGKYILVAESKFNGYTLAVQSETNSSMTAIMDNPLNIAPKRVASLSVTGLKLSYNDIDKMDYAGASFAVTYNDGTQATLTYEQLMALNEADAEYAITVDLAQGASVRGKNGQDIYIHFTKSNFTDSGQESVNTDVLLGKLTVAKQVLTAFTKGASTGISAAFTGETVKLGSAGVFLTYNMREGGMLVSATAADILKLAAVGGDAGESYRLLLKRVDSTEIALKVVSDGKGGYAIDYHYTLADNGAKLYLRNLTTDGTGTVSKFNDAQLSPSGIAVTQAEVQSIRVTAQPRLVYMDKAGQNTLDLSTLEIEYTLQGDTVGTARYGDSVFSSVVGSLSIGGATVTNGSTVTAAMGGKAIVLTSKVYVTGTPVTASTENVKVVKQAEAPALSGSVTVGADPALEAGRRGTAQITWAASDGNGTIAEFLVYVDGTAISVSPEDVASDNSYTYTVRGLTDGISHAFAVSTVNQWGESPQSDEIQATAWSVPAQNTIWLGNSPDGFYWRPNPLTQGTLLGFQVKVVETAGGKVVMDEILNSDITSIVANSNYFQANVNYTVSVSALNEVGASLPITQSMSFPTIANSAPATPAKLQVTAGDKSLSLTWTKSVGAASYTVMVKLGNEMVEQKAGLTDTTVTFHKDLLNGTEYTIEVYAVNAYGSSVAASAKATPKEIVLTGIELTTKPSKLAYTVGETFNPAGMVVTASYSDGSKKPVTDYTLDKTAPLTLADTTVTVSFGAFSATLAISVKEPVLGVMVSGYVGMFGSEFALSGVTLTLEDSTQVTTDNTGYFEFTAVADGEHTITITTDTALTRTLKVTVAGEDVVLSNASQMITLFLGDFNGDEIIDGIDFTEFGKHFNTSSDSAAYEENVDYNKDGMVDGMDFTYFGRMFNKTTNSYDA